MKWILVVLALVGVGAAGIVWWRRMWVNPEGVGVPTEGRFVRYDFDSLQKRGGIVGEFEILGPAIIPQRRDQPGKDFESRQIRFLSDGKWITGMMNYYPERSSLSKVIIMVRGYAEKAGYYSGSGTWKVADELVRQLPDLATISIDFLGYAESDSAAVDVLEARFEKVVSVMDLIETVRQLPWVDKDEIGIWAHSNGGQIVLSVLEVTGENYPTVLWAPMTQKFPDSVLSTVDADSLVKGEIENFLKYYDARRYAFENYLQWIEAPIVILQGTNDEWVRVEWQEELRGRLKSLGKEVELVVYKGADHNLKQNWKEAVERSGDYYKARFGGTINR